MPICEKFIGTLNSLGINAAFLHTNSALHGDLGVVRQNDIVILLSKSGETKESIELAGHLINFGVDTWLISFNSSSTLSRMIKDHLIMSLENEGDGWDIMPNNSTSVYLILLQGLAMQLKERLGLTKDVFKKNHPSGRNL